MADEHDDPTQDDPQEPDPDLPEQPTVPLEVADLLRAGLTFAEAWDAVELRDAYRCGAFVPAEEARAELRLRFARWLWEHGRLGEWPNGARGDEEDEGAA